MAQLVSQGLWFLLALVFWISNPKSISVVKKSKLSVLPENWHTEYGDDADSYSDFNFSISNPKSIFGQIWAEKAKIITCIKIFSTNRLNYCNLGHCVPYVVFMFWELVIFSFCLKISRVSRGEWFLFQD